MPRSKEPQLGQDGQIVDARRCFADQTATILARNERAFPKLDTNQLKTSVSSVVDILQRYWRWKHNGSAAFSRSNASASLEWMVKSEAYSWMGIQALNSRAQELLMHELWQLNVSTTPEDGSIIRALQNGKVTPETIKIACDNALQRLRSVRGPDPRHAIDQAVYELCQLYETYSGNQVTHSNKGQLLAYDQCSRSYAGVWVGGIMKLVDQSVWPSQISNSMRKFISNRNIISK